MALMNFVLMIPAFYGEVVSGYKLFKNITFISTMSNKVHCQEISVARKGTRIGIILMQYNEESFVLFFY
jgi:hypothetical protein